MTAARRRGLRLERAQKRRERKALRRERRREKKRKQREKDRERKQQEKLFLQSVLQSNNSTRLENRTNGTKRHRTRNRFMFDALQGVNLDYIPTTADPLPYGVKSLGAGSRVRRSLVFDDHDVHHMEEHSNNCTHKLIDHCSLPQCNAACPRLYNPYTGQEMRYLDMLMQFGIDPSLSGPGLVYRPQKSSSEKKGKGKKRPDFLWNLLLNAG